NEHIALLADESVHLTVTSPPYVTTEFKRDQDFDYDGFIATFGQLCEHLYRVTVPGGRFALNIADIITKYRYEDDNRISRVPLGSDTFQSAQGAGFRLLERFIWDKGYTRNFGGPLLGSYPYPLSVFNNNYFEYLLVLQKPGKRHVSQGVRDSSRMSLKEWRDWTQKWWRIESESERCNYHRAIFPIEIPYRLIRMYSYIGDTVLDPYMGTGATMLAADRCGRTAIGFERDPKCERWMQLRMENEIESLFDSPPKYKLVCETAHASN
ncbi:MAG: site-specific DNA-methyltransferase, partial [Acidimicrobiia bacterium]|nr:site-specific DNA-methyltransferase [Acidimicrobiia bacterium]